MIRPRILGRVLRAVALASLLAWPVQAQEPRDLPYAVTIAPTPDAALNTAADAVSQLVRLREPAPTSAFGVIGRARGDLDRFQTALRSEGYYGGSVAITIAGQPLDTPDLATRLEGMAGPVPIEVRITPGPQYRITRIALLPEPPSAAPDIAAIMAQPLAIADGDPARAAPVLDASAQVVERLRRRGHPLAAITDRDVVVDHETHAMEITWRVAPGPHARFAAPEVTGAQHVDPGLLRRIAARRLEGREYDPERIERARRVLLGLGPFGAVRAEPGTALDASGAFPIGFVVSERPFRAVGFNLGWETNYGFTGSVYWEHRNLFGAAERLRVEGEVSRFAEGGDTQHMNYRAFVTYRQPEVFMRDIQLVARIGAVRERLDPYDRDVALASLLFEHPLTDQIVIQAGPGYEVGRVGRYDVWTNVNLVSMTFGLRYDSTDSLLNPTRGFRVNATAIPYMSLDAGASFTRLQAVASTYWNVTGDGRTVIALRAGVGSALGAPLDALPYDKRFYAGGGGSVRGFPYLSIGPLNAVNQPIGGASLVEGSIEWRQRVHGNWGMVLFADAASVGLSAAPGFSDVRVGVGTGLRYQTAIGPIRVDLGIPVNREPGGPGYGLYVGIGQAF